MAPKTPVAAGTAGYVDRTRGLYTGVRAGSEGILAVGAIEDRTALRTQIFYFDNIDDGDIWTSNITGIKAAFWSGETEATDAVNAVLTTAATGAITFETTATSDLAGFVLLFIDSPNPADGLRAL